MTTYTSSPPAKRRRLSSSSSTCSISDNDPSLSLFTAPASVIADDEAVLTGTTSLTSDDDSAAREIEASQSLLDRATHVLTTEAAALASVTDLYKTCPTVRSQFSAAVTTSISAIRSGGKLIFSGVGKSAYIAQKLTATCKSLSVRASFMHACEAAHGDLGDIHDNDIIVFVSFSGRTPELINLLPHIPASTRIISLSSPRTVDDCALVSGRPPGHGILLSAPIPEKEEESFGVSAPTTSTTVALAVGDMFALSVAREMHIEPTRDIFKRNHPGGAIGIDSRCSDAAVKCAKDMGVEAGTAACDIVEPLSPCASSEDG